MGRGDLRGKRERQKKCLALLIVEMEWMSPLIKNDNIIALTGGNEAFILVSFDGLRRRAYAKALGSWSLLII